MTYTPGADGSPAKNILVTDDTCSPVEAVLDDNGTPADVTDDFIDGDTDQDERLDGGETWVYLCDYTVPAHADNEVNTIINTATLAGNDYDGVALTSDTDTVSLAIEHDAGTLTITKDADVDLGGPRRHHHLHPRGQLRLTRRRACRLGDRH